MTKVWAVHEMAFLTSSTRCSGEKRLQDATARHQADVPRALLEHIFKVVVEFRGATPLSDDITMLASTRKMNMRVKTNISCKKEGKNMPSSQSIYGLLLTCLCACLVFSPLPAPAQASAKDTPLLQLLAQARTLVTEGTLKNNGTEPKAGEEKEDESRENLVVPEMLSMLAPFGFTYKEKLHYEKSSPNADVRRLARLEAYGVFDTGHVLFLERALDQRGNALVPRLWRMGLHVAGSGSYFQHQLVLVPDGLLDRAQVDHIIDVLKATGHYKEQPLAGESQKCIEAFAHKVHGLQNAYNAHKGVVAENLIFNDDVQLGARIIISPEATDKYALFILMGDPEFYSVGEDVCRH